MSKLLQINVGQNEQKIVIFLQLLFSKYYQQTKT